ncbi:MAG: hypothetical protein M1831_006671 [Alyxoria varia]|nr:MAG: hypothetical protein M1831_006671 [Alyxoria varia]
MAEAAGIVLASLSLVVSCAEHYRSLVGTFCRYRRYPQEVEDLRSKIGIQRTKFNIRARDLLANIVSLSEARDLLNDPSHPSWNDEALAKSFDSFLGDSRNAIYDCMRLVSSALKVLEEKSNGFHEVLLSHSKDRKMKWRKQPLNVLKKIEFSFSKSRLSEGLQEIRTLMQDFLELRPQSEGLEQSGVDFVLNGTPDRKAPAFSTVQNSAHNLYTALEAACKKHAQHQARLSLRPIVDEKKSNVQFTLAFGRPVMTLDSIDSSLDWLNIESVFCGSTKRAAPSDIDEGSHRILRLNELREERRSHDVEEQCASKKVTIDLPSGLKSTTSISRTYSSAAGGTLVNLCSNSSLCNRLQNAKSYTWATASDQCCIGYLQQKLDAKYLVYMHGNLGTVSSGNQPATTLLQMLENSEWGAQKSIRTAKELALALLNFYSTPWFRGSWSSSDVFFHQQESAKHRCRTVDEDTPYVDVPITSLDSTRSTGPLCPAPALVANQYLYNLGIVMLEIAFRSPLQSMRKRIDLDSCHDHRHQDYFTAERISRTASSMLGQKYSQIARKCLRCDFGRGDDLAKADLQHTVYKDVVCELEEMQEGFKTLGLA